MSRSSISRLTRYSHLCTPTIFSSSHCRTSLRGAANNMWALVTSAPYFWKQVIGSTPLCLDLDIFSQVILACLPVTLTSGVPLPSWKTSSSGFKNFPVSGSLNVFP